MKPTRKKIAPKKKPAANRAKLTKRQIRAELYNPANIEKAQRLDRGVLV